uniref:OmpA family protein n=1 Tax=uncultured Thiotrichaceae bacterium TaxID=298394 RepID=A0A6S6SA92_9GAMM|nr:MAG: OmpA family protein [uncultured Thiotrichaceae bacterium]
MKFKTLFVLLLASLWGTGSWWWYTCKIKGHCQTDLSILIQSQLGDQKSDTTTQPVSPFVVENEAISDKEPTQPLVDTKDKAETTTNSDTKQSTGSTEKAETTEEQETLADSKTPEPAPETKPADLDNDNDGIPNPVETRLGLDPNSSDTDKDGVNDFLETGDDFESPIDSDNDNIINALDEDDDGDGDPTRNESPDPNQDGDPDDAQDIDNNGIPDYLDPATHKMGADDDGDGLNNGVEKMLGTNPTLTDSDGDGLSDVFEAEDNKDSDGDGTIDALDPDDDDDGIMTAMEDADPNGDGNPEDAVDSNDNDIPDYLDTDNTPTELPSQTTDKETQPEENSADDKKPEATESKEDRSVTDDKKEQDDTDKVTLETSGSSTKNGSINKARLYFPFRSSEPELADSVADYFDLIIKQLKDNPDIRIRVTGHTDSVGRGAANRKLGRERAEQVRSMLVKRGAPKSKITIDSEGEGEPIADNKTDAGRKKNRRVEIEQVK